MPQQKTIKTRVTLTVEWDIHTTMKWNKDTEPPEERIIDVLADTAPGSTLAIEEISPEYPTWDCESSVWDLRGCVKTSFTESIPTAADELSIEDVLQIIQWIEEQELRGVSDYSITTVSSEEIVEVNEAVSLCTAEDLEKRLNKQ